MEIPKRTRPLFLLVALWAGIGGLPNQCHTATTVTYEVSSYYAPAFRAQQSNQKEPDLSGTYSLDESKSDAGKERKVNYPKLEIVQHGPEIRFIRRGSIGGVELTAQATLYADGRGETLLLLQGAQQVNSKTKWDGDKLVTRYTVKHIYGGRFINYDVIEAWKLSKDGKTLTHDTRSVLLRDNSPGRISATQPNMETKEVFRRVSN